MTSSKQIKRLFQQQFGPWCDFWDEEAMHKWAVGDESADPPRMHPYTCGNRSDGNHEEIGGDLGTLVPTKDGWICPFCDYKQEYR